MQPWGTATGRILDENGKPLGDAAIGINAGGAASRVRLGVKTDKQGRFRAQRVIPGLSYTAKIYQGPRQLAPVAGASVGKLVLRPGRRSGRQSHLPPSPHRYIVRTLPHGTLRTGVAPHAFTAPGVGAQPFPGGSVVPL